MDPNQPQPTQNISNDASEPVSTSSSDVQKSKASMATTIICAILAVAGIGAAIYFFMDANNKATDNADLRAKIAQLQTGTSTGTTTGADNSLSSITAQNIVNPYLKTFNYLHNILDYDLNEDTKALLTYLNTDASGIMNVETNSNNELETYNFTYYSMNDTYQSLFGDSADLPKKDYAPGHATTLTWLENSNAFKVTPGFGGGAGSAMFSIVKKAYYDNEGLAIEVYHDVIPWCGVNNDDNGGYCSDSEKNIIEINDGNMSELIEKFSDKIPVYKMIFTKNAGHYVLKSIQKQ